MKRVYLVLAALALPGLWASSAEAAMVSYYLNQTNANPALGDIVNYAQATIDENTANRLTFTVTLLAPLTSIAASNFGIQEFAFNVAGLTNPLQDAAGSNAQWVLPTRWTASLAPPPNQMDGFGRFEVAVGTTGSARLTPLIFQLVNSGLGLASFAENSTNTAAQGNSLFAAHITGFNVSGVTSAYFGGSASVSSAVPVPAAIWLLSSGLLGGLGWARRRVGVASA